jgi:hypothetical protein
MKAVLSAATAFAGLAISGAQTDSDPYNIAFHQVIHLGLLSYNTAG